MTSFHDHILTIVRQIPKGKTLSYKQVAAAEGSPGAARAVGTIMSHNQDKTVPCHRVIRSDGKIGAYNGLQGKDKQRLLEKEKREAQTS